MGKIARYLGATAAALLIGLSSTTVQAGDCTNKTPLPTRNTGDSLRIVVFLKTDGRELTSHTGKRGRNNENTVTASYSTEPSDVDDTLDLRSARGDAIVNSNRSTQGGFKVFIHLAENASEDDPENITLGSGVCVIDADQRVDGVEQLVYGELSRLKCRSRSGPELRVNSCKSKTFARARGVHVAYWADVEFD